ncbi:MAG TPA: LysR family transcriptional regulator [Aestuariivirga sp.]
MPDWEDLRHFAAFARAGSLSAAARLMDVEHATVSRRVASLETSLSLKLVDRRGRILRLTPDGERIAALTERMVVDAEAIDRSADGAGAEFKREVSISAPPALSVLLLAEPLAAFRSQHPGVTLRIIGESRFASLDKREADIAIRLSRPSKGNLTIVKLGDIAFRLYASRSYLAGTRPNRWTFIGYDETLDAAAQQVELARYAGKRSINIRASNADMQQALARQGAGVAMLATVLVGADSELVPAVPNQPPVMRGLWLVLHSDMQNSVPVRAMAQHLKCYLHEILQARTKVIRA